MRANIGKYKVSSRDIPVIGDVAWSPIYEECGVVVSVDDNGWHVCYIKWETHGTLGYGYSPGWLGPQSELAQILEPSVSEWEAEYEFA